MILVVLDSIKAPMYKTFDMQYSANDTMTELMEDESSTNGKTHPVFRGAVPLRATPAVYYLRNFPGDARAEHLPGAPIRQIDRPLFSKNE
jgi:hypothetical protein